MTKISREETGRPTSDNNFTASYNLIAQYNPLLPNIKTIVKKYLSVLHSHKMLQNFPKITIN